MLNHFDPKQYLKGQVNSFDPALFDRDLGTPARTSETTISLVIDGIQISVPEGTSVMRAAALAGITVPKLCATMADAVEAHGHGAALDLLGQVAEEFSTQTSRRGGGVADVGGAAAAAAATSAGVGQALHRCCVGKRLANDSGHIACLPPFVTGG